MQNISINKRALASRRYRDRRRKLADEGDQKAIAQIKRDRYNSRFSNARSFISNYATVKDMKLLRNIIDENLKDPVILSKR